MTSQLLGLGDRIVRTEGALEKLLIARSWLQIAGDVFTRRKAKNSKRERRLPLQSSNLFPTCF
jgi:hypothetical protein